MTWINHALQEMVNLEKQVFLWYLFVISSITCCRVASKIKQYFVSWKLYAYTLSKCQMGSSLKKDHGSFPHTRPWKAKNLNDWQQRIQNPSETSSLTATHFSSLLKASKPAWLELILWTWQKSLPLLSLLWKSRKIPSTIQVFKTLLYIEERLTSPESLILNLKQGTQHTVIKGKKNKKVRQVLST